MIFNAISFLPYVVFGLIFKSAMYCGIFRWQRIKASLLTCVVIAGSGIIVSFIPLFFIPTLPAVIALATYLCFKYTGIPWFPNALVITAIVEIVANAFGAYVLVPVLRLF